LHWVFSAFGTAIFTLLAGYFLIRKSDYMHTLEWRVALVVMLVPYFALKASGVFEDETRFVIGIDGENTGFGHVPLALYAAGPAQLLSWGAYGLTKWLRS
jgi:hypothetical protein